jgi:hypothetical protein
MNTRTTVLIIAFAVLATPAFCATAAQPPKQQVIDNQDVGKAETAVGDLVADAFRSTMCADIAFVSAGDLKQQNISVGPGGIKPDDATAVLMYSGDALVVLALDGRMIQQALETSVSGCPKPSLSFLQASGLKMVYGPARPSGQRVTSVTVGGLPIAGEKSYTVAMLNSLANGALGYWKVWSKRNIVPGTASATSASAVESYVKTNPKIGYSPQGRIAATK